MILKVDLGVRFLNNNKINYDRCLFAHRVYVSLKSEVLYIVRKLLSIEAEFLGLMLNNFDNNEKQIFEKNINKSLKNIRKIL